MRRLLAGLGAVALAAALSFPVHAGNNPLVLPVTHQDIQDPVEQLSPDWHYADNGYNHWRCLNGGTYDQFLAGDTTTAHADNCVHNHTGCQWDVDDQQVFQGTGDIATGATVAASTCIIADLDAIIGGAGGDPKRVEVDVRAPVSTLTVRLISSVGADYLVTPTRISSNTYDYKLCGVVNDAPVSNDPISGSNGGYGDRVDWTLSITAARAAHNVFAVLQTGFVGAWWICPPYP